MCAQNGFMEQGYGTNALLVTMDSQRMGWGWGGIVGPFGGYMSLCKGIMCISRVGCMRVGCLCLFQPLLGLNPQGWLRGIEWIGALCCRIHLGGFGVDYGGFGACFRWEVLALGGFQVLLY